MSKEQADSLIRLTNFFVFTAEVAGVVPCLFYFDLVMTHTHRIMLNSKPIRNIPRYLSYFVVGFFVFVAAYLLIWWCLDSNKKMPKPKPTLIIFQILFFFSLCFIVGYAYFFDSTASKACHITSHSKSMLYVKLMLLMLGLLGFVETSYRMRRKWLAYNDSKYIMEKITIGYFLFLIIVSISFFFTLLFFLISSTQVDIHALFLFSAIFCSIFAVATAVSCFLFNKNLIKIISNQTNKSSFDLRSKHYNNNNNDISSLKNLMTISLLSSATRSVRNDIIQFFSWILFSISFSLLMSNHTTQNFVAICLLFGGFILKMSLSSIQWKKPYDEDLDRYLVFHNVFIFSRDKIETLLMKLAYFLYKKNKDDNNYDFCRPK